MLTCKTVNWDLVIKKAECQPWASALIQTLEADFENHMKGWSGPPTLKESQWGHHYFCNVCGVKLAFAYDKPHEHICPKCNKVFLGEQYDGAWCKVLHTAIVSNMERALILAHLPNADKKYVKYIHDTILFYSNNYINYPIHGKCAGFGKVYPQMLSEALFIVSIERIIRMTSDLSIFSDDEFQSICDLFFRPAFGLMRPQVNHVHNIHAWMQAAIAACANMLSDKDLLNNAIYGRFGWMEQLENGTSEDGIWYEISTTYHYTTLDALLSLAWIALENDIDLFKNERFAKMASAYPRFAYPDGLLPSYDDGFYGCHVFDNHAIYEELSFANPDFDTFLAWLYANNKPEPYVNLNALFGVPASKTGYSRSSMRALLYGAYELPAPKPLDRTSFIFKDTGIAVLQNDNIRVSVKFSGDGGCHDHNDKISIDLYANDELLSYDPGTSGYGISLTELWSRTSIAHNLVCINGKQQRNCKAKLLEFSPTKVCAEASKAYNDAVLKRCITLKDMDFTDVYQVNCEQESCIDWIFHCVGELSCDKAFTQMPNFTETNGYDQLFNLKSALCDEDFTVSFTTEKQVLKIDFIGEKGTKIIIGNCYGKDMTDIQHFAMLRRNANSTIFDAKFNIAKII